MEKITKLIEKDRPNIRPITLRNYTRYLTTILKGLDTEDIKVLKSFNKVKTFLNTKKLSVRKALTASILVYLRAEENEKNEEIINKYRIFLLDLNKEYHKDKSTRQKSEREDKNWTTLEQLHEIRNKLHKRVVDNNIPIKNGLTSKNMDYLQQYVVASLYTLLPPRRNIYASVKLIKEKDYKKLRGDDRKQNYLVYNKSKTKIYFHFGRQKSKNFDEQKIDATKELKKVLKLWLKFNDGEYLLMNKQGNRMTENGLTKYLNKVFKLEGKKISSSMIRKIFSTEITGKAHQLIEDTAEKMGHSVGEQKRSYVKK
tara:strand:+ start:1054 stop:1992 length:939 start_codon:yes stop_codon:yes gene_type:complete